MSKENKSNDLNHEEMIAKAFELILYKGWSYTEFRKNFSKLYDITERQAENYWKECKVRLKKRHEDHLDHLLEEQITRYLDLLDRCKKDGNKRTEREVLADLNKLFSLETKKVDVTTNGQPITISINLTE